MRVRSATGLSSVAVAIAALLTTAPIAKGDTQEPVNIGVQQLPGITTKRDIGVLNARETPDPNARLTGTIHGDEWFVCIYTSCGGRVESVPYTCVPGGPVDTSWVPTTRGWVAIQCGAIGLIPGTRQG